MAQYLSHANQTSSNNGKDKSCHKWLQKVNAIKKINHASATKLTKKRWH